MKYLRLFILASIINNFSSSNFFTRIRFEELPHSASFPLAFQKRKKKPSTCQTKEKEEAIIKFKDKNKFDISEKRRVKFGMKLEKRIKLSLHFPDLEKMASGE